MAYFGTTTQQVIDAMSGIQSNLADFGGTTKLESIMGRKEDMIGAKMPDYISQFLYGGTTADHGLIRGHIIVEGASEGQNTSDYKLIDAYEFSTIELYLNWPTDNPDNPTKIEDYYLYESTDWSILDGIVTFNTGLGRGDQVMANYETTWSAGIKSLQDMLIAFTVEELINTNFGEVEQALWTQQIADAKQNLADMSEDKFIPKEIAVLKLHKDRKVNQIGQQFKVTRT